MVHKKAFTASLVLINNNCKGKKKKNMCILIMSNSTTWTNLGDTDDKISLWLSDHVNLLHGQFLRHGQLFFYILILI